MPRAIPPQPEGRTNADLTSWILALIKAIKDGNDDKAAIKEFYK